MGRVHRLRGDGHEGERVHGRTDHRDFREPEAGAKTADICRKHGISSATFYKWKARFGGLEVSDAKRLKALEDENTKLKKLLAEAMLDNARLKEISSKNVWSAPSVQGSRT
jgi:putative transposase